MIPSEMPFIAWYPSPGDPRAEQAAPHFEVVGSFVYPADGHPSGASFRPWFQLRGQYAYRVDGHPDGPSSEPCLRVVGSDVHQFSTAAGAQPGPSFRIGRDSV